MYCWCSVGWKDRIVLRMYFTLASRCPGMIFLTTGLMFWGALYTVLMLSVICSVSMSWEEKKWPVLLRLIEVVINFFSALSHFCFTETKGYSFFFCFLDEETLNSLLVFLFSKIRVKLPGRKVSHLYPYFIIFKWFILWVLKKKKIRKEKTSFPCSIVTQTASGRLSGQPTLQPWIHQGLLWSGPCLPMGNV